MAVLTIRDALNQALREEMHREADKYVAMRKALISAGPAIFASLMVLTGAEYEDMFQWVQPIMAAAQQNLLIYGGAAALAILFLLQASFGSLRLALLLFLTLPMALVGGVLAVWMGGGILSLGSLIGFLTVFGIAARNGILMISHFQHLEREEGEDFGPELVLRGAKERLAPILMTALATGLALVPLVASGEIPGAEIEYPMAIVILGGLVTATLLNLFIIPALYLRFGRRRTEPAPPAPTLPTP